jgi:hypothetical protein
VIFFCHEIFYSFIHSYVSETDVVKPTHHFIENREQEESAVAIGNAFEKQLMLIGNEKLRCLYNSDQSDVAGLSRKVYYVGTDLFIRIVFVLTRLFVRVFVFFGCECRLVSTFAAPCLTCRLPTFSCRLSIWRLHEFQTACAFLSAVTTPNSCPARAMGEENAAHFHAPISVPEIPCVYLWRHVAAPAELVSRAD